MSNMMEFLHIAGAVIQGHFVFKAGYKHGDKYVDKETFSFVGARKLIELIRAVADNAVRTGLNFGEAKEVGVIGPAYGAIPFTLTLAGFLEERFPEILFFPARTQLVKSGEREVHYIPDKLLRRYRGKTFIKFEDIVNNGKTCRESKDLFETEAEAKVKAILCFVNRADQTAKSLGVEQFYPYLDLKLGQHNIKYSPCPQCEEGVPINVELGKGEDWVKKFGQPPYPPNTDFSSFWGK